MTKKESIEQFLAPKKFALAGASRNKKKFGHMVFKELREKGFDICPINPNADEIDGVKCYKSVSEIPEDYKKLFIATQKTLTDEVISQAAEKGIDHVWVQQMAQSNETRQVAEEKSVNLIDKECIFMFAEPTSIHKFHRGLWKLFGLLPK